MKKALKVGEKYSYGKAYARKKNEGQPLGVVVTASGSHMVDYVAESQN